MNLVFNKKSTITYLFKKGRRERLLSSNNIPSEFFYGYKELKDQGYHLNLLEESDLNKKVKMILFRKFLNFFSKIIFSIPFNTIFGILFYKSFKKLQYADQIIVTTNSLGIALSCVQKIGLISSKILFINMGLFSKKPNFIKLKIYQYIFKKVTLITISRIEYKNLKYLFNGIDVKYLPFGVDDKFWFPQPKNKCKPYILSIGNDLARDWDIIESIWDENLPILKIVTSSPIQTSKNNIQIIKGNWHSQELSDTKIRDLYRDSEFVILPIKETFQPSGQSSCLQAMACSKAVIISNIKGIWDRKLLKDRENVLLVKAGDKKEMYKAVNLLLNNIKLRKKIERKGCKLIENHFNILNMKNNLIEILEDN